MRKNGFTLIELLGTIVILGLIALIATPPVINQIKNSKKKVAPCRKGLEKRRKYKHLQNKES